MNNWIKSSLGVTVAGLIVLFATYGQPFVEALKALWLLVLDMSKSAPLGLASFGIALSLATGSRWFMRKWVPYIAGCPLSRDFIVDASALVIGVTVTMAQMWGSPQDRLSALWLGVGAGLVAPLLYNGLAAVFGLLGRGMHAMTPAPRSERSPEDAP